MRFRKLDFEELTSLEKEFKEFLIINHIHDEEWRNLNKDAPEKVSALIEVFSDTVLLKVYGKISYLEFYGEDIWSFFKIDKEWINTIHIQVSNPGMNYQNKFMKFLHILRNSKFIKEKKSSSILWKMKFINLF